MLAASFAFLSAAVALGAYLLARPRPSLPILHGAAGAAGLVLLVVALRRGSLGGVFALDAAWLLGAGLCGGLAIATLKARARRIPGLLLLLHATAGGLAYLLLAGFVFGGWLSLDAAATASYRQAMHALALTLDSSVHLIQVALTPVFLLSGIAALLNVFAGRLARVADRLDTLSAGMDGAGDEARATARQEMARLHRRSVTLDIAVVLGTLGAAATCLAIMTLFLLALSNTAIASILLLLFGLAILCTLGSVIAFGLEMLMSSSALRSRMHVHFPTLRLFAHTRGADEKPF